VPAAAARDVIDFPAGKAMGSLIHTIFERIDASHRPLREEVQRVVNEQVTSRGQRSWKEPLVEVLCRSLETPLGKPLGDISLADISAADRLLELDFSCGLASLAEGLRARQLGELLQATLTTDDPLRPYADTLASPAFDMPIGGLLTGSIDAVFRLPGSPPAAPKLLVCDYKSNKLHRSGMAAPLAAYAPEVLPAAMAEHHYPLQALLYGSALFRLLRWRLPEADPDDCVAGVLYAFIRGMQGRDTPADEAGCRSGVFFWKPPRGLWQQLSDLLAGASLQGAGR
jgi:exodeoxyribonuclease V beta subunit